MNTKINSYFIIVTKAVVVCLATYIIVRFYLSVNKGIILSINALFAGFLWSILEKIDNKNTEKNRMYWKLYADLMQIKYMMCNDYNYKLAMGSFIANSRECKDELYIQLLDYFITAEKSAGPMSDSSNRMTAKLAGKKLIFGKVLLMPTEDAELERLKYYYDRLSFYLSSKIGEERDYW